MPPNKGNPKKTEAYDRLNEVMQENARLKKKMEFIERIVDEKCGYSFDLVWYARSSSNAPAVVAARKRVEDKYPKEVAEICDPDGDNWQHGFNSAVLGLSRLLTTVLKGDKFAKEVPKLAEEGRFPDEEDEDFEEDPFDVDKAFAEVVEQAMEEFPMLNS